jgi:predicted ribosomally synthesized peptide with SipW-like signal peptide
VRSSLVGRRRSSAALGVLLSVAVVGGVFAYWTQSGTGTGTAQAGTTQAVVVNQGSAVTGLYPGGPAVGLSGDFDNPNDGPVKVGTVSAVVSAAWSARADLAKPACTAADFAITTSGSNGAVNAEVPAGNGVGAWSGLNIAMVDAATNQDNCKGVTVDLDYTVTAAP